MSNLTNCDRSAYREKTEMFTNFKNRNVFERWLGTVGWLHVLQSTPSCVLLLVTNSSASQPENLPEAMSM